jgi:hypothetical protein
MGLAELIEVVKDLPEAQQNEVIDFAEFVANKHRTEKQKAKKESRMTKWFNNPILVEEITPLTRDEIYGRQQSNADTGMTFAEMLLSMPRLDSSEWHEGLFERDQTSCREVEF